MSTRSVQYAEGPEAVTDAAPFPIAVFCALFFAVELGVGFAAFAATAGPTLTVGVGIGPGGSPWPQDIAAKAIPATIPTHIRSFLIPQILRVSALFALLVWGSL